MALIRRYDYVLVLFSCLLVVQIQAQSSPLNRAASRVWMPSTSAKILGKKHSSAPAAEAESSLQQTPMLALAISLALALGAVKRSQIDKSVTKQKPPPKSTYLDYFPRPGDGGIVRKPLSTARAAWYGPKLAPEDWRTELTQEQAQELTAAVKQASSNASLATELSELTISDCDFLPAFVHNDLLPKLKKELGGGVHGYGVHLVRGIPVKDWTRREHDLFFWMLGLLLGRPGAQDADGLLLQHVKDTGADPDTARKYKTKDAIDFHCDGADVVGLMCLQASQKGGTSRIISSVAVYNEFVKRYQKSRPDMVERLYQPFPMDLRSETTAYVPITPVKYSGDGQLRTFYMKEYFQSAYRHSIDPPTTDGVMPALDAEVMKAYDEICDDPRLHLDMQFEPGDIQLLNNHVVLHARTAYEDAGPSSSAQSQRHLLRLWLSMPEEQRQRESWRQALSRKVDTTGVIAKVLWAKMRYERAKKRHQP